MSFRVWMNAIRFIIYSVIVFSGGSTVSWRNGFIHCSSLLFEVTRRVPLEIPNKCKVVEGIYIVSQNMIKFQETLAVVFASLFIACSPLWSIATLDGYISCACTDNPVFWRSFFKPGTESRYLPIPRHSTNNIFHN